MAPATSELRVAADRRVTAADVALFEQNRRISRWEETRESITVRRVRN